MAVFISYSHADMDFTNRLLAELVKKRVPVWIDSIEINVGDSLVQKVQDALQESDFLAIVLSKNSTESEWCKKELSAGLIRELGEKRVVIFPVLIDDCEIPLLLQDKKYADFRESFEAGLADLVRPLESSRLEHLARTRTEKYLTDFAHEWGIRDDSFYFQTEAVSFEKRKPYSVYSRVDFVGNDVFTKRFKMYTDAGLGHIAKNLAVAMCEEIFDTNDAFVTLPDEHAVEVRNLVGDPKTGVGFDISIRSRRLGEATGQPLVYHFGSIFGPMLRTMVEAEGKRKLSQSEHEKLKVILSTLEE